MEDTTSEVLFETWLYKLSGLNTQNSKSFSTSWKKRYFVLLREGTSASLLYYVRKPKTDQLFPKGYIELQPYYKILKKGIIKGKFVCELITETRRLLLATDDLKIFHLFYFFMQTQTKIRDDLEGKCFVVRPDNSEDHRCIGATANISVLHVSQWGITLALELSKCVLAQWPLNCIKRYECSDTGQFSFETGRRAPTANGHYMFRTRRGDDRQIFNILDSYVDQAAAIQQQLLSSRTSAIDDIRGSLCDCEMELQQVTYVCCEAAFTAHLQRVSRTIYDHLLTHIGGGGLSFRKVLDAETGGTSHRSRNGNAKASKDSPPAGKASPRLDVPVTPGPPLMTPVTDAPLPSQYLHMANAGVAGGVGSEEAGERYVNMDFARSCGGEPRYAGLRPSRSCDELRDDDCHVYHNAVFRLSGDESGGGGRTDATDDFRSLSRVARRRQDEGGERRQRRLRRSVSNPDLLEAGGGAGAAGFRRRAAALGLRLLPFASQLSTAGGDGRGGERVSNGTTPPKAGGGRRTAGSMKEARLTEKSRAFVKQASVLEAAPGDRGGDASTPPLVSTMEGRRLPNLPAAHTAC